jgi:TonB family protein
LEIVINLTPTILSRSNPLPEKKAEVATPAYQRRVFNPGSNYIPGVPRDMVDYVRSVQRKISSRINYPQEAENYGWEGTVKLGLLILSDGTLAFATVKESSGYDLFDNNALKIAKEVVAPFERFPSSTDLQELDITIPIIYSMGHR